MKTRILFLSMPILIFSCKKSEDLSNPITPNVPAEDIVFDESIFGKYTYYSKSLQSSSEDYCKDQEEIEITKTGNDIAIGNKILHFSSANNSRYEFNLNPLPSENIVTLTHYPCSDSIEYYEYYNGNSSGIRGFGKKINGKDCPNSLPSTFEPISCANVLFPLLHCYSSVNTKINDVVGILDEFHIIFIDSLDQTIQFGIIDYLGITVPTDSTFTLLEGDYWIGHIPQGDKPILDLYIENWGESGLYFNDFTEGHLNVKDSIGAHILTFDFKCLEPANWTGCYVGIIN